MRNKVGFFVLNGSEKSLHGEKRNTYEQFFVHSAETVVFPQLFRLFLKRFFIGYG